MKTQIIQLEAHDDSLSVRDKMGWGQASRIVLVWPKKAGILKRRLDLLLLQRRSQDIGAQLGLVTHLPEVHYAARQLNIPVFKNLRQAQSLNWRTGRRRTAPKRPVRRSPRPDLQALREEIHPPIPVWYETKTARRAYYSITLLIFLAAAGFIMPGAQIYLVPQTEIQSITYEASTSEQSRTATLSGYYPGERRILIIKGEETIPITNLVKAPVSEATGAVVFTNLSESSVQVPEGSILAALDKQDGRTIRFMVTRSGVVPAGPGRTLTLPVRALSPGTEGNLPPQRITAIEGSLGINLSVTNLTATSGGMDREIASPSPGDYNRLRESLIENLFQTALDDIKVEPPQGYFPIPSTLELEQILQEIYEPPPADEDAHQTPSTILSLTLRLEFSVLAVAESELHRISNQILDANLRPDTIPLPETLVLTYLSPPRSEDGLVYKWKIKSERQVQTALPFEKVVQASRGKTIRSAKVSLQESFELSAPPEVIISPDWWPLVPGLAMRIKLVSGTAPLTMPAPEPSPSPPR